MNALQKKIHLNGTMKTINTYISTTERISSIDDYITEKLHINNTTKIEYMYHPKTKGELIACIREKIDKEGLGAEDEPLNLNDIDTSKITDMSELFDAIDGQLVELSKTGYFDISDWDVSNVKNMEYMFNGSKFNGDISDWDVSKVENMSSMFYKSSFTNENSNISKWDVSNVEDMSWMFAWSKFTDKNGDISDWNVSSVENMMDMFYQCPLQNNPPKWYKSYQTKISL